LKNSGKRLSLSVSFKYNPKFLAAMSYEIQIRRVGPSRETPATPETISADIITCGTHSIATDNGTYAGSQYLQRENAVKPDKDVTWRIAIIGRYEPKPTGRFQWCKKTLSAFQYFIQSTHAYTDPSKAEHLLQSRLNDPSMADHFERCRANRKSLDTAKLNEEFEPVLK
jgi:hypothetical protein